MLKRVSIQNFKSLKDVTLDLQKVNLLIGPNNSGKTNFLKALESFMFGGYIFQNVEALKEKSYKHQEIPVSYEVVFESGIKNTARKHSDAYNYKQTSEVMITSTSKQVGNTMEDWLTDNAGNRLYESVSNENRRELAEFISTRAYRPDPNKLLQPSPVGTGAEVVNADASNLIGFLDRMLGNKYRKSVFNRIETDLYACVPEFDEINLDDAQPTEELQKQFGDKSFKRLGLTNSKQEITYWADELSEGTLYFLTLLCIINQPNPPRLLLLEEPEKGIHPRRIREIMNFVRRLVAEKDIQVIMTTHSPMLLDEFAESPESVFVFDKDDDGATFVKNLQRDVIEPANQKNAELGIPPVNYTDALGEYWTIGFLGGVPHETA